MTSYSKTLCISTALAFLYLPACAETWVPYYKTGSGSEHWDIYTIDKDSVRSTGKFIKYKTRFRDENASIKEKVADCTASTHGQPPDATMYSTYPGTMGREEVNAACKIASEVGASEPNSSPPSSSEKQEPAIELLADASAVRHLSDGIMASVAAGNFNGTLSQIHQYMELPEAKQKEIDNQFGMIYTSTLVQLGPATGSELIKENSSGDWLIELQYAAKYERSAMRWIFLFYKKAEGWSLVDVRIDPNLHAIFGG